MSIYLKVVSLRNGQKEPTIQQNNEKHKIIKTATHNSTYIYVCVYIHYTKRAKLSNNKILKKPRRKNNQCEKNHSKSSENDRIKIC